jgi:hypothetical protein
MKICKSRKHVRAKYTYPWKCPPFLFISGFPVNNSTTSFMSLTQVITHGACADKGGLADRRTRASRASCKTCCGIF